MSLFFRNLFFTILQPGLVAGLIPFWIVGNEAVLASLHRPFAYYHYIGLLTFLIGFVLTLVCIVHFAIHGRGTLSPADPTKQLVIAGPYRFSRNPMYLGVMMLLLGESIFFQSIALGMYSLVIFLSFYIFVTNFEEPRLRKDFGNDYDEYCRKVHRWL
ncbi:methyltransferase family protein [Salmonirosea aquatica]|uniref:Isoprenylcysteine carboxyl methyltransferase n=1 Tax=Salmonirosea aquatica TaxID=2654236 RepID=A0A7C9BFE0_9BACT|nr:isoprenylcysteine carboxyl methyltransferase [Cytophagaceae bacterium SJW1-29]